MSVYRILACDYCNSDHDSPSVGEDQFHDDGGTTFTRREYRETVYPAIAGTNIQELRLAPSWHTDERDVCGYCLSGKNDDLPGDVRRWLEGWEPNDADAVAHWVALEGGSGG